MRQITGGRPSTSANGDIAIQWEWSNFDSSQNQNPLTDYDKTSHNWLRSRDEHVTQNLCQSTLRERLGKYVKYKALSFFILINFFPGLTYWSDPWTDFHVNRRTANKKLAELHWPSRKRSRPLPLSRRTNAPTFKFIPAPLIIRPTENMRKNATISCCLHPTMTAQMELRVTGGRKSLRLRHVWYKLSVHSNFIV